MDAEYLLNRREFLKLCAASAATVALPAKLAFSGTREVTDIPEGMQKLGFELVPYESTHVLKIPALEL